MCLRAAYFRLLKSIMISGMSKLFLIRWKRRLAKPIYRCSGKSDASEESAELNTSFSDYCFQCYSNLSNDNLFNAPFTHKGGMRKPKGDKADTLELNIDPLSILPVLPGNKKKGAEKLKDGFAAMIPKDYDLRALDYSLSTIPLH